MTIAVFGGTGKTGRLFVAKALAAGHKVRVLARDPDKIAPAFGMEMIEGDAENGGKIMLALSGCQAVALFLGPAKGSVSNICSLATEIILQGMAKVGIKRLLAVTSLGVGDSVNDVPWFFKIMAATFLKGAMADKNVQESIIRASSLDWTIVRPSGLAEKETGLSVVSGYSNMTQELESKGVKVKGTITRAELAQYCWDRFVENDHFAKTWWVTT